MTPQQKEAVAQMRKQNLGYAHIARKLDVSINAVKAFCRRNGLVGQHHDAAPLPGELSETSPETDLTHGANRGMYSMPADAQDGKSNGRPGNRPVCQVTVSYSAVPDETAVDDVLGMLINANYAR
ncbi:hypothetical protein ACH6CV_14195 [Bacillota bacterium Meth-B3]